LIVPRLSGPVVAIEWDGSAEDPEKARAEVGSALAEIGFDGSGVKFVDEFPP
jgi:hypothetical protein